jgi:hypothetical protein
MKEIREFIATDIDSDAVYSLVRTAGGKMFVEVFYSASRKLFSWELASARIVSASLNLT